MAEAVTELDCPVKISCCSRNSAVKIKDCIQVKVDKKISEYDTLIEEQKSTTKARFIEIFDAAFKLNLEIDGQNWADAGNDEDCTSEYESLDMSKKAFITNTLSTKLDDVIVKVAQNRKTVGKRFKCKAKKVVAAETEYLSQVHMVTDDNVPSSDDPCVYDTVTCDRLSDAGLTLSNLTKTTTTLVQRFNNLEKAVEISETSKTCKTDQIIFNPTPDEGKMAESITPLKRKLRGNDHMSPAKRRNSARLANDSSPLQSLKGTPTRNVTVNAKKRCSPRLAAKSTDNRTRLKS
ncbi:uncharacterized protein LOC117323172 [Pecten maximus]|uniref:uncharacterized protein LOC117323172 n=1 Tax=Pecten maximus TaxID=6579 RepID=UPI001458F522|nr:uncharacterized protein LOC117323172 [Pecten maximus]